MSPLRRTIRAILYEHHKYDLGCPTEEKCDIYKLYGQEKACELCPKHLNMTPPEMEADQLSRLQYLTRLDNMHQVGCMWSPNDLDPATWDQLIVLTKERNWIQEKVSKQKEESRKKRTSIRLGSPSED